jgi:poly-gamma-glutamate synthesis protein (capsule biosynthesis protein)
VGFANHEASSFDLPGPPGATQAAQNGGGYPRITAAINRDLRNMGIRMVSMANNHAGDWGPEGLLATLATVQASGLVQAGAGASLGDARRPGVVFTPRGTAALIATASTFNPATVAADGVGAVKPRPGISVLRARPVVWVTDEQMVLMRRLSAASWSPNSGVRDAPGRIQMKSGPIAQMLHELLVPGVVTNSFSIVQVTNGKGESADIMFAWEEPQPSDR